MIKTNPDHEEIAQFIVKTIADDETHAVKQTWFRQRFTNPYRLHEYDLALKILKDFDVIQHNHNDRLTPGNLFYTYKSLKALYKPKIDWKFWIATIIAIFGVGTAFYFSYTDRQKSNTIDELERTKKELLTIGDSLQNRVIYLDSLSKVKVDTVDKTTTSRTDSSFNKK